MPRCSLLHSVLSVCTLLACAYNSPLNAQKSPFEDDGDEEFFVMLESFAKYGGEIKVIDGLTGNNYTKGNDVVMAFHSSMPKIMGGFHNMLLAYEAKHIKFRVEDGLAHELQLKELAESFGIKNFKVEKETFLSREKAIYSRLFTAPFFHLDELIVWELDQLNPSQPDNKYTSNIHFDAESQRWRRRAVTKWNVVIPNRNGNGANYVEKFQGLDLDSQAGFHEIENGLPSRIFPNNFKDVKLSYPIFIDRRKPAEEQIEYLQRTFVKNLRHLYDPFSWVARRSTRFSTGFAGPLQSHLSERSYKVTNRDWFDKVFSTFLNDVVIVKRHSYEGIYEEIASRSTNKFYENQLGVDLDLLNWNPKEKRVVKGKRGKVWNPVGTKIKFESAGGARYILLDAYLRNGDKFLDNLRGELTALKKKEDPIPLFKRVLAKTTGIPADKYIALAFAEQRKLVGQYQKAALAKKDPLLTQNQNESNLNKN